jgi:hypothetical protein
MNLSKAFAATAMALALGAVAAPSHAATTLFAAFDTGASNARNFRFVNGGPADSDSALLYTTANAGATTAGAANVLFSFLGDPALSGFDHLSAKLTLTGSVVDTPATFNGVTYTQTGVNGAFQFVYSGPTTTLNGISLVKNVTHLLDGTFTNAWIQGQGGVGGMDVSVGNGGSASYASSIYDLSGFNAEEFTIHLGAVAPNFGRANASSALNSFRTHIGGEFQGIVPEPATWALMIMGFGSAGAMLRAQRRRLVPIKL